MTDEERPASRDRDDEPATEVLSPVTDTGQAGRIRRRRWLRRALALAGPAAILAILIGGREVACRTRAQACLDASPDTPTGVLLAACAAAYKETGDTRAGLQYVRALYRAGEYEAASELATSLLSTPCRADALFLLGRIALKTDRPEEAARRLQDARALHEEAGRWREVAEDEHAIADVLLEQRQFARALRMLDRCIATARTSGNRRIEGYCHLTAGRTLIEVGLYDGAGQELDRALPLLDSDRDAASLHLELGNVDQELGHDALAVLAFQRALPAAERAEISRLVLSLHLNLAYSLAESMRLDEATRHLEQGNALDRDDRMLTQRIHLEGRIAYRRGNLSRAASLLERAERTAGGDELLLIDTLRARVALESGDLPSAERWARRGVDQAEVLRAEEPAPELRAWMLSNRKEPYELLFTVLARSGRVEDALLVFDKWYGRSLLEGLSSSPLGAGPLDLESAALQTEELSAVLPSLTSSRFLGQEPDAAMIEGLRRVDLLALIMADGVIWRVTSTDGRLAAASIGARDQLDPLFDELAARPVDPVVAERLGDLLLPDALARDTDEALRVVLDGPLSFLPIAALRKAGRPIVAMRPVVRSPRLGATGCAPAAPPPSRILVLADPRDNLPSARAEARQVATRFQTQALLGDAATSTALFEATPDLLHIAAHADVAVGGGVLQLGDRTVSALEIFRRKVAARRVVLATCGSARRIDDKGATSLTTAFLAGGAAQVVATLRPVTDAGAEEVTGRFYRADGAADPVRALARVQAELAGTENADWPNFAVYGQDVCR